MSSSFQALSLSTVSRAHLSAADIFAALEGSWDLQRTIKSAHPSLPDASFTGRATFSRSRTETPECTYLETGTLLLPTALLSASRAFVYRLLGDDLLEVHFAPGDGEGVGLFVALPLAPSRGGIAQAMHPCGEDRYDARFDFSRVRDGRWSVVYQVRGPMKDYVSETLCTRVLEGER